MVVTMNRDLYEDADFFLDMETSIQNKKRRRCEALDTAENGKFDEDYVSFLEGLQEFWEAKFVEDDDDDPTYLAFLGNLKEHGNAYVCELSIEYGVLSPIIYEVENDSPNVIKRKTPRSRSVTCFREKRNLYQDGDLKSTRKNSGAENNSFDVFPKRLDLADNLKSGRKNSESGNDHTHGIKRKTPLSRRGDRVRENISLDVNRDQNYSDSRSDHHDEIKRKTPRSRRFDRGGENRSLAMDSDQKNSDYGNDDPDRIKRKTPHSCKGDHVRKSSILDVNSDQNYSDFCSDYRDGIKKKTPQSLRVDRGGDNRSLAMDSYQKNSCYGNDDPERIKRKTPQSCKGDLVRKSSSLDVNRDQNSGPIYSGFGKKMFVVVDETYEEFLKSLHVTEDSVFYENGKQERIFFEPSDQQTTDVEIEKDTRPPSSTLKPSAPILGPQTPPSGAVITTQKKSTPTDSTEILSVSNETCKNMDKYRGKSSSFWKKVGLHDYLRKPYKKKEHKKLLKQLATRKPVSIHRESRSGGSYRPGRLGNSYLDIYPELQHKIEKVKSNPLKVINLLRMCKFFVQKIPSIPPGVCMPWKDGLTKKILPQSS